MSNNQEQNNNLNEENLPYDPPIESISLPYLVNIEDLGDTLGLSGSKVGGVLINTGSKLVDFIGKKVSGGIAKKIGEKIESWWNEKDAGNPEFQNQKLYISNEGNIYILDDDLQMTVMLNQEGSVSSLDNINNFSRVVEDGKSVFESESVTDQSSLTIENKDYKLLEGKEAEELLTKSGIETQNNVSVTTNEETGNSYTLIDKDAPDVQLQDGSVVKLHELGEMMVSASKAVGNFVKERTEEVAQEIKNLSERILADLALGKDIDEVAEQYTIEAGSRIGFNKLLETFGLQADQYDGSAITSDKFLDSGAGQAVKGAIMQFAITTALNGKDMDSSDYANLAANSSINAYVNYSASQTSWGASESGGLSPAGAGATAAAVAFTSNLIQNDFEINSETVEVTAIAGVSAYLGAAIGAAATTAMVAGATAAGFATTGAMVGSVVPIVGTAIGLVAGAIIGSVLGGMSAEDAPPPPPLFITEQKEDGTGQIIFVTQHSAGYGLLARDGFNDDLIGGTGSDNLIGSDGNNKLIGNDGDDNIQGKDGEDIISGGKGSDYIVGGEGSDQIDGGDGNDEIYGDSELDRRSIGISENVIYNEDGEDANYDDVIFSKKGDDSIFAGIGNDYVNAGEGNDYIEGGSGNNTLQGGSGDDEIIGGANIDNIDGGSGNDTISSGDGDDVIYGDTVALDENGNVILDENSNPVFEESGNDNINSGNGNDNVFAGGGDDIVHGNEGEDTIYAGDSNDIIFGDQGNDIIYGESGNDTISGNEGNDIISGGDGDDIISGNDGDDDINSGIGNDIVYGNDGEDIIRGDLGNDNLHGGLDDDLLYGGVGNDNVHGNEGNDHLHGEIGNDTIYGNNGNDTITGGSGDDILYGNSGNDNISGNDGSDTLDGGSGTDSLSGGSGDDTYIYKQEYGNVDIVEESGTDTLSFTNLRAKDLDFSKTDNDLVLTVRATGNKITVKNHFLSTSSRVENLSFADGYNIQLSSIILGTDLDDTLTGTSGEDTILSFDGDDTIIGQGGDDYLNGGDGNDVIYGGTGNDRLDGSYKDDYLDGGDGNDNLVDGLGSDRMFGGAGNDNFVISQNASDTEVITDFNHQEDTLDLTSFGNRFINLEQLQRFYNVSESSGNTVLNLAGGQTITLENLSNANFANSNISFDIESISGNTGSDKNEIITGTDGNDVIVDGKGLDVLTGGSGADLFQITKNTTNNDIDTITDFSTSSGDKIDIRSFGDYIDLRQLNLEQNGSDTIIHFGKNQDSTTQKLVLKNINKSELTNDHFQFKQFDGIGEYTRYQGAVTYDFSKDNKVEGNQDVGAATYLNAGQSGYQEGTSTYETDNFFTSDNIFNEGIDQTLLNPEYDVPVWKRKWHGDQYIAYWIRVRNEYLGGSDNNDEMHGSWWDENIYGYGGHDKIFGNNGHDSIWAGVGNDWVDGGNDGDIIYGENGRDIMNGGSNNDHMDGGADNDTIYGNSGNDNLHGNTGDDYLIGEDGSDTMYGDDGHDLMIGDAGSDYLNGGNGDDRMDGGSDSDNLYGGYGNDGLIGGTGNDYLRGEQGNDKLEGGDGDDTLYGNSGDDELLGNAGNDILYGNDEGTFGGEFDIKFTAGFAPSSGGWVSQDKYPREFADINGDGFADLIGFASGGVYTALSNGSGGFASAKLGIAAFTSGTGGWNSKDTYPRELADINGDGMADIVGFASGGVFTSLAKGDGTFHSAKLGIAAFTSGTGGWNSHNTYPRELADINGDGLADIVGFASRGVFTSLAKGDGTFHSAKLGIAAFTQNTGGWNSNDQYPRELADVNGDGFADIVGFASGGVFTALAKGDGTFNAAKLGIAAFTSGTGGWNSNNIYPRRLADVNGDGFADIVGFASGGVLTALAKGDGTFNAATYTVGAFNGANGWSNNNTYPRDIADLNGDNKADIIGIGSGGIYTAIDTSFIANNNRLDGGDGDDRLFGTEGNDHLIGGTGEDYMEGSDSHDKLEGGTGNDWAHGGNGVDEINGEDGHDILYGGSGQDNIQGGAGSDIIDGGNDGDTISGGDGNDLITANQGDDTVNGDAGNDMILGSDGNDTLSGGADEDHIEAGTGNDTVNGNAGNDIILGGSGNDTLSGNDGADKISGGSGDDSITGGLGMDLLHGGDGVDTFNFDSLEDSSVVASDIIEDFEDGVDQIKISQVIADSIGGLTISNDGTNTYIDDIDSDFQVSLNGVINLDNTDFIFGA